MRYILEKYLLLRSFDSTDRQIKEFFVSNGCMVRTAVSSCSKGIHQWIFLPIRYLLLTSTVQLGSLTRLNVRFTMLAFQRAPCLSWKSDDPRYEKFVSYLTARKAAKARALATSSSRIERAAGKHSLCPLELSLSPFEL